ncbi:MAG: lytic transglycosylase F [Inquilinus sp.]|nr:lytic transglycosylase F [Inquilinus sp.]
MRGRPSARSALLIGGAVIGAALALVVIDAGRRSPPAPDRESAPAPANAFTRSWAGDFDAMIARGRVRALVPYSPTFYYLDRGTQRGLTYELLKAFEDRINADYASGPLDVRIVVIPVSRDRLIPGLLEGLGDIAAGNLTVTPEREASIDFSRPILTDVSEILVTGPSAPAIATLDDLSGLPVHVRRSSSYHASLLGLNEAFEAAGRAGVELIPADEHLEDEDLLELVDAGLVPMIVMDLHKAKFWAQFFPDVRLHPDIAVRSGGAIAWAFREDNPGLRAAADAFIADNAKGSLLGNILFNRYLNDERPAGASAALGDLAAEDATIAAIVRHADAHGIDWPMVAAVGYQESRLDQRRRSAAGAVGVMQVLPGTAADPNVGIADIESLDGNIEAGAKYLRFLHDRYFVDSDSGELDRWLLTFAAYNAGPARVAELRRLATERDLDPDRWFGNVELVAADRIGRETVEYVRNVYKFYIAFGLIEERMAFRSEALDRLGLGAFPEP